MLWNQNKATGSGRLCACRGTKAREPSQKCVNKHRISSASAAGHRVSCNGASNFPAAGGPIHTTQETNETTERAEKSAHAHRDSS